MLQWVSNLPTSTLNDGRRAMSIDIKEIVHWFESFLFQTGKWIRLHLDLVHCVVEDGCRRGRRKFASRRRRANAVAAASIEDNKVSVRFAVGVTLRSRAADCSEFPGIVSNFCVRNDRSDKKRKSSKSKSEHGRYSLQECSLFMWFRPKIHSQWIGNGWICMLSTLNGLQMK